MHLTNDVTRSEKRFGKVMAAKFVEFESFKAKLVTVVRSNVSAITAKCLECKLLDEQALTRSGGDVNNADGAQVLLEAVENGIKRDPKVYDAFIAILEETLTGDCATLASEMKKELRDREHVAECSDAPTKLKPSKMLEATKVDSKAGAIIYGANTKSAENGHLVANGGASKHPVQVCDNSNDLCAYVGNPPPKKQQENLENAKVFIQSVSAMQNTSTYRELQQKCGELEKAQHEKEWIQKKLSETCKALEGLVEEKKRKEEELQRELDAMKAHVSGIQSLKHSVSSEFAALQKRMATMQVDYERRIKAELDEKNELTKKLKQKELQIEQSDNDIERLMAEIEQLRQRNKCLVEENCELKKAQQRATMLGVFLVLISFALMAVAILGVGAYTFSFGSYTEKREEL